MSLILAHRDAGSGSHPPHQWRDNGLALAQYLVGLAQPPVLLFEDLDAIPFLGRDTVAQAACFLGLLDPFAQGLGDTANSGRNARARLRLVGALMLEHHPDRTRADLWRVAI
jgi:hypothetical protein